MHHPEKPPSGRFFVVGAEIQMQIKLDWVFICITVCRCALPCARTETTYCPYRFLSFVFYMLRQVPKALPLETVNFCVQKFDKRLYHSNSEDFMYTLLKQEGACTAAVNSKRYMAQSRTPAFMNVWYFGGDQRRYFFL